MSETRFRLFPAVDKNMPSKIYSIVAPC